jgi:hypothetical protein
MTDYKMEENTMTEGAFPEWNRDDENGSVTKLYQWLCAKAEGQIAWYEEQREPKKKLSQRTRGLALLLGIVGAVCPLLQTTIGKSEVPLAELGYIFIALGAGLVTCDRFYGFSSSWMRFARTQLNLVIALDDFRFEWAALLAQPFSAPASVQKLKEFSDQIDTIVKAETDAWINEFQSNLKEMEKMLKTSAKERKPGNIKVTVSNGADYQGIDISVDGVLRKQMPAGASEALIDHVMPGPHELLLVAIDSDEKEHQETRVVTVTAGATAETSVTIS